MPTVSLKSKAMVRTGRVFEIFGKTEHLRTKSEDLPFASQRVSAGLRTSTETEKKTLIIMHHAG